jgi:DsbC/DsbD-like thiol-disulfide interchange protein
MKHTSARLATIVIFATLLGATCALAGGEYSTKITKGEHYKTGVKYRPAVTLDHKSTARLWVVATDGWHMNAKFPYKVTVTAPDGVSVDKATFAKADALSFSDSKVVFKIPFTVTSAGTHTIKAKVNLAVCTGDKCAPHVENLSWTVQGSEASGG